MPFILGGRGEATFIYIYLCIIFPFKLVYCKLKITKPTMKFSKYNSLILIQFHYKILIKQIKIKCLKATLNRTNIYLLAPTKRIELNVDENNKSYLMAF